MAELLDRARQLVAAGPWDARPAEVAAVHDAIWPEKAPVCPTLTCRQVLGIAYYAIKRWAEAQPDFSTSTSSNVKKNTAARFKSDTTIYTPHGLGVAYSNTNLTDKAARDIIKNDPDAVALFDVLPSDSDEDEQDLTPAQASAEKQVEKAQHPALAAPAGFDYAKLAAALLDESERRQKEADAAANKAWLDAAQQPAPASTDTTEPALTASAGGAGEGAATTDVTTDTLGNGVEVTTGQPAADHDDEQPVRLSRMNKEQLLTAYRVELRLEPAEGLTNDQLRDAIAEHRAGQQDSE